MKKSIIALCFIISAVGLIKADEYGKVSEFGVGINIQQFPRATLTTLQNVPGQYNYLSIDYRAALFGINVYCAWELNPHFYFDIQGNADFGSDPRAIGEKFRYTLTPSVGIQWRLGSYMRNKVIDPFVRVGIGFQYRNYNLEGPYDLSSGTSVVEYKGRGSSPVIFGAGSNFWISDRWGIGMEADFLVNPQKKVDNQWQGMVRLVYRHGGKPIVKY